VRSLPHSNSRITLGLVLSLLLLLALLHSRNAANRVGSESPITAQQILARSEPICAALAPDPRNLTMSADYTALRSQGQWTVACTDSTGRESASLQWEGTSGTLLSVGACPRPHSGTGLVLRTPNQARTSARMWLDLLGYSRGQDRPGLRCAYQSNQWIVECRFESHDVVMHLDPHNGLLTFASITHKE
jgi:hypothetical protein